MLPLRTEGGAGTASAGNLKQTRFELAPGATLEQDRAPAIAGRGISVTATVTLAKPKPNGVILSQGGSRLGYTLYLDDGKPVFAVRNSSGVHEIRGTEIASGKHELQARLSKNGKLQLEVDGASAGADVDCPLLSSQPGEGLLVGRDDGGAVGSYRTPNEFNETIHSIVLELSQK